MKNENPCGREITRSCLNRQIYKGVNYATAPKRRERRLIIRAGEAAQINVIAVVHPFATAKQKCLAQ